MSCVYQSETVWTHSARTFHWGLERAWQCNTSWDSSFQQNYEEISHTFLCTFGNCFWQVGWQKRKSQACVASLPSLGYFQQSAVHFLALAFLAITSFWSKECVITESEGITSSGFVTNVTDTLFRMRNILLDCPHEHLASLRTQHQLVLTSVWG